MPGALRAAIFQKWSLFNSGLGMTVAKARYGETDRGWCVVVDTLRPTGEQGYAIRSSPAMCAHCAA